MLSVLLSVVSVVSVVSVAQCFQCSMLLLTDSVSELRWRFRIKKYAFC
jgi:hypothetical protein